MTEVKKKVSVSLDSDLVAELETLGGSLSSQVNEALRLDLGRRRRQRLLGEMLSDLEELHGPVDETLVQKYTDLLT